MNEPARHAILVCGSRYWTNAKVLDWYFQNIEPSIVLHGACRGADDLAAAAAKCHGHTVIPFPYISELQRRGGPIRNKYMLHALTELGRQGFSMRVIAFHDDPTVADGGEGGTADMLRQSYRAGVPCFVVRSDETWEQVN